MKRNFIKDSIAFREKDSSFQAEVDLKETISTKSYIDWYHQKSTEACDNGQYACGIHADFKKTLYGAMA